MTLLDQISFFATNKPDKHALVHPQFKVTWKQFNEMISNCAIYLLQSGLKANSIVGVHQKKSLLNIVTSLALMKLGVPFIDISDNITAFKSTRNKLGITEVVSDSGKFFPDSSTISLDNLSVLRTSHILPQLQNKTNDSFTYFIKTSGTTGWNKYISLTNSIITARFQTYSTSLGFNEEDFFWTPISTSFSSSKLRYFAAIHGGATIVIGCNQTIKGVNFLNSIGITKMFCTPSQLLKFIEIGIPLPTCVCVSAATSPVSEKLRRDFRRIVNENLYVVYGTSEVGLVTEADQFLQARSPNTVGFSYPSVQVQVVDDEDFIVSSGTTGNIRLKSPGMCDGYFLDSKLSEMNFRDGWFYPGDLGYLDSESSLIFQGRSDDMMIFDGVNLHPIEIENCLNSHFAVLESAAFSISHKKYGEIPIAAVVLKKSLSELDLMKFCFEELGQKMPRRILFVEKLPKNEMGKILRKNLTDLYSSKI